MAGWKESDDPGGGPAHESRVRNRSSIVCDERVVFESGHGPDRALHKCKELREEGVRSAEKTRREGGAIASRQTRRQADPIDAAAGRIPGDQCRGSLQAG